MSERTQKSEVSDPRAVPGFQASRLRGAIQFQAPMLCMQPLLSVPCRNLSKNPRSKWIFNISVDLLPHASERKLGPPNPARTAVWFSRRCCRCCSFPSSPVCLSVVCRARNSSSHDHDNDKHHGERAQQPLWGQVLGQPRPDPGRRRSRYARSLSRPLP